jgi:hypothetical protein
VALTQEWMYYEVAWHTRAAGTPFPFPWWQQQRFRWWSDDFDAGLFSDRQAAVAANALYRYWNMVGVKDQHQECLVGQAGEAGPVYDDYSVSFCLFEPGARRLHLPQLVDPGGGPNQLSQSRPHLPARHSDHMAARLRGDRRCQAAGHHDRPAPARGRAEPDACASGRRRSSTGLVVPAW